MDTTKFDNLSPEEYKRQTQANWTEAPCGSSYADSEFMTKEFFEEVESHRYSTHPWIIDSINNFDIENKKVLEIGYGMGTDHLAMARRGGIMHGLDLTPRNLEVTRRRFKLSGYESQLAIGDAEDMPFESESMDFVYAFGVVHHTPGTEKAIREIHRVLKPGGRCFITVYHKDSIFFWWSTFFYNYLVGEGFYRKRSIKQQISLIEYPNTNENLVIKLYKRREFAKLFDGFSAKKSYIRHLLPADIWFFAKFFPDYEKPRPFLTSLGNRFGWYVIVEAEK